MRPQHITTFLDKDTNSAAQVGCEDQIFYHFVELSGMTIPAAHDILPA